MLLIRIFLLTVLTSSLSSCWVGQGARENDTKRWILLAKRPIKVMRHSIHANFAASPGNYYYTLIDKNGSIYLAKGVRFQFPEVIE